MATMDEIIKANATRFRNLPHGTKPLTRPNKDRLLEDHQKMKKILETSSNFELKIHRSRGTLYNDGHIYDALAETNTLDDGGAVYSSVHKMSDSNEQKELAATERPGRKLWRKASDTLRLPLLHVSVREKRANVSVEYKLVRHMSRRKIKYPLHSFQRRLLGKFRLAVRLTVFCANTFKEHCLRINENKDELAPYIKRLHFHEDDTPDLLIDLSKFKANRQLRIPDETKRILSKEFEQRSPQEVYSVTIALRNIKSFAEYPKRMQQKISEVGLYEKYESKRVIVRQGHPASAFYFILSGAVVVMVMDEDTSYARPVAHLYKGQTFGELAIINGTKRNSTVIAKETCEFLSISARDYHKIFMAGGVKNIGDPDQESFLRGLNYLSGWPIHKLQENPNKCQFLFFKDSDVIVRDSEYSDWLIVVKSGSIQVLKKLKKVSAYEWKKKKKLEPVPEREDREYSLKRTEWRRILPELRIPLKPGAEVSNTKFLSNGKPVPFEHPCDEEDTDMDEDEQEMTSARIQNASNRKQRIPSLWPISVDISDVENGRYLQDETLPSVRAEENKLNSKSPVLSNKTQKPGHQARSSRLEVPRGPRQTRSNSVVKEEEHELLGYQPHIRTIMEDIDSSLHRKDDDGVVPADLNPEFVHVQTLTKGQIFGLTDLIIGSQPSFSVISRGADCILINKTFYEEHAPEKLLREMRQQLCPYPSEEEMQQRLQVSVDWQEYRKVTLKDSMENVHLKKFMRLTTYGTKVQEAF